MPFLEPDDLARRYGHHPGEQGAHRSLFVHQSTQDDLLRWLAEPSQALERLRPGDLASADFTADELAGVVREAEGLISLSVGHEGGLLHELAARAASEGRAALVIDQSSFYGSTGFAAFTVYEPGAERRTSWIDPLRGLKSPDAELTALIKRFVDSRYDVQDWIETVDVHEPGKMVGIVHFVEQARVLRPPEFRPWGPSAVRPLPLPVRQVASEMTPRPPRPLTGLIALLLLAPGALIAPWFWCSLGQVSTFEGAMTAAAFSLGSVGWFAFIPVGWLAFRWRAAWFMGMPLLVSLGSWWAS